jgi:DNA polymerase III alpha subunit
MQALLANEPDHQRVMQLIREAEKMGIEVFQPDVDFSGDTFKIVGENILAGLADLKGVGQAAVGSIVEHQPFKSFGDFVDRVELRKVHKGVIIALVKAGAMSSFVPNGKWFLEHVEELWKKRTRKNWSAFVEAELVKSKDEDDFEENDRLIIASQVSPLAYGDHPIELHADFLNTFPVDWGTTAGEDIFERRWCWIRGVITETRFNQIGAFHTGAEATPEQKLQKRWGARYASLTIEDASGIEKRIIVDFDVFDELRSVIEKGPGTPVVALVLGRKNWKNARAYILLDVNDLREKSRNKEKLTNIEAAAMQPEKLFAGMKRNDLTRRIRRIGEGKTQGVALVAAVQHKPDKNLNEMGFVVLYGRAGIVYSLAFASVWPKLKDVLKVGSLLHISGKAQGNSFFIDSARSAK